MCPGTFAFYICILQYICSIQLQDQLCEKDKELKTLKLDLELHKSVAEAKIAETAAGKQALNGWQYGSWLLYCMAPFDIFTKGGLA